MKALKSLAWGLTAALSLGSAWTVAAHDDRGGGSSSSAPHESSGHSSFVAHAGAPSFHSSGSGFHASAPAYHSSSGSHAPAVLFYTAPRTGNVHASQGSAKTPTFAFGGHPADPRSSAAATQRSNGGSNRPTSGWHHEWDRIWHGHHYHWNHGAWVIINDGDYPWDDSDYFPASPDVVPDMSYDYGDTPSDAGAPNPYPNAPAARPAPRPDSIAGDVQQSLASRGYYDGQVDGIVGDGTRQAIADFQKDNNLPVTGYITKSLLNALGL